MTIIKFHRCIVTLVSKKKQCSYCLGKQIVSIIYINILVTNFTEHENSRIHYSSTKQTHSINLVPFAIKLDIYLLSAEY